MTIPVTIVTGFLGAGKTSLIKRILKAPHGLRIGLILNEIGQAGIDQVPEAERAYVELTEGCACCVRNSDLIAALREVTGRGDIDRILLETSGLADPLPLSWSLTHPEIAAHAQLDAVVVALDARHRAEAADEEWQAQVRAADLGVLTKLDLASPEAAAAVRKEALALNPQLRLLEADEVSPELILDVDVERPRAHSLERMPAAHSDFGGVVITDAGPYRADALEDLLEALPSEIFRAKGIARIEADEWVAFHVVGGRVQTEFDTRPPPHGESRIALFGRRLDEPRLRQLFKGCRL